MSATYRVAHPLFNGACLGQVSHKSIFAVFVGGMASAYDGKAVPEDQLVDGGGKDRSWYVDQNCLRISPSVLGRADHKGAETYYGRVFAKCVFPEKDGGNNTGAKVTSEIG